MRKKSFRIFSWVAGCIALLITAYFVSIIYFMEVSFEPDSTATSISVPEANKKSYTESISVSEEDDKSFDTIFGRTFMGLWINDSLPHYIYRKKEDSIKSIKNAIELRNKSAHGGMGIGSIGLAYIDESMFEPDNFFLNTLHSLHQTIQDSLKQFDSTKREKLTQQATNAAQAKIKQHEDSVKNGIPKLYYFTLVGYSLNYPDKFYVSGNKYYLANIHWESIKKNSSDSSRRGRYGKKQIPFRYSEDSKEIMIPISKHQYNVYNVLFNIGSVLIIFFSVYVMIGLPIQLLINISRGKAFTRKNISILIFIAVSLFIMQTISVFSPYMLRLIFSIPEEFKLEPILNHFLKNFFSLFIPVIVFIISLAFKKGYKLQEEQELTV